MRRALCVLAVLLLAAPWAGADKKSAAPSFFPRQEAPTPKTPEPEKKTPQTELKPGELPKLSVDEALEKLDLPARVAQLLLVTLQGEIAPNAGDLKYLREYTPGGVIVRQAGLPTEAQLYVARVRGAELLTGIPMLVGCDLYALARANRGIPSQFVQLPSLLSLAAAHDSGATDRFARILATHMHGMGFDLSLGPSLELAPTIKDAQGTIYTFGSDPVFAADAGATLITALNEAGVAAAPMGFPGGGANRRPKEPAVLLTARNELATRDLLPYARALGHGTQAIHVGNTLVPTIDKSRLPASLSPAVINQLLREEMGFEGLVIAGPLDSEEVTNAHDPVEAAMRALDAGADLLYFQTTLSTAARVVDKLSAAVAAGDFPRDVIDRAARRVIARKLDIRAMRPTPAVEKDAKKLENKRAIVEEAYAVERKAITLIKNNGGVLPLTREGSTPAGITGVVGVDELYFLLEKPLKILAQQPIGTARHLGEIQDFEIDRVTQHAEGVKTAIVVLTDQLRPYGQRKLVSGLKEKGAKVVVILLGYPGNAAVLDEADAVLLAYCDGSSYAQTLRALGDVLLGKGALTLRSDLPVIPAKVGERRAFNVADIVRSPAGRLPMALGEAFPAGFSVNYGGQALVKHAEWDFGNGASAKGTQVEYAYPAAGQFTLQVRVSGEDKETTTHAYPVEVAP